MLADFVMTLAPGRGRQLGKFENGVVSVIAIATSIFFILLAFGVYVQSQIALNWFIGAILAVAFLTTTGNPKRPTGRTVFSWTAAILSIVIAVYFTLMQPIYDERLPMVDGLNLADQIAGLVLIVLVLEATRRCIGMTLVLVVLVFLAYGIFGHLLTGPFWHRELSLEEMLYQIVYTTNGLFGPALAVAALLVFAFVAFGTLLDASGGGDFFFDLANSLVGRQAGGPAKVAVVSSGLYGSISGSPTSDVVTTGSFTIPLMIRTGLTPTYAGAVEATASTGGALLPPVMGTAAFLMSDFTGIPYSSIAIAAVVPALLYYLSVFLAVHLRARVDNLQPSASADTPSVLKVLRHSWFYLIPIFILIWYVLTVDRPAFSAALAMASLVPILLVRVRNPVTAGKTLVRALDDSTRRMTGIGVACAVAGLVVGTLAMTDLTGKISSALFLLAHGNALLTLIIATVIVIVLGMGMPTPAVYALASVLAAPALLALNIPLLPAHLFIVYFASMSAITPPVAVAAFAAGTIANANPMAIGLQCCRLAIVAFIIPYVFIYNPGVLLIGSIWDVVLSIVTATIAIIALVCAQEGYLTRPLGVPARLMLIVLGLALMAAQAAFAIIA
ncbi:MAG: TRAP transporter fused permease subunit [Proteobacteria bacterium]|nr:TRAP transporter fused permease subunit [Pseudomonadota bacterium]